MGVIEEVIKDKEQLITTFLKMVEGKEARAKLNLDGIRFKVGKSAVHVEGAIEFTFVPVDKKKK